MIRSEESVLTDWYFRVDRRLLAMVLLLTFIGMLFMISAGSVAAERVGHPWHFFILKALPWYAIGLVTMFGVSMLNTKWIQRLAALNLGTGLLLLLVTLVAPRVINGSSRWVKLGPFNLMPADIMKPGFIFVTAWFLAQMQQKYGRDIFLNKEAWQLRWLSWWTYLAIFAASLLIMFTHPDFGTCILYFAVFCAMIFIAGLPFKIIPMFAAGGASLLVLAFFVHSHVRNRIISWVTGTGDTYQIRQSIQSIQHGGLLGSGDDAFVKQSLPDAHTDFIFAAIVEDVGAILACGLLALLLYTLKRLVTDASNARDPFVVYATGGAAALFGTQVCINLMSTLHLFAPKGMTLPFISYGGSSFLSFCLLFGMVLAVVREDKWK